MAITDPRDISGLKLWYSAEAETGYSNDGVMTGWTDLSGNGNHATAAGTNKPTWQSGTGPSATGPAVHFNGVGDGSGAGTTGHFTLPASVMGSATAGEVFYQLRVDSTKPSSGSGHLHHLGHNAGYSYYPFSTTNRIYDAFGSNARKDSLTPAVTLGSWHRLNIWSAASDWAMLQNETSIHTTSSNTVSWPSNPAIGTGADGVDVIPTSGSSIQPFKGWMSTVILYDRKLTTGERSDLATWMAAHPNGGSLAPPVPTGTATGNVAWAGSATGKRTPKATATGTVVYVGSATGKRTARATATGTVAYAGSATGKRIAKATATGTLAWGGTAVGGSLASGTATGSLAWAGSAVGDAPDVAMKNGTAAGTLTYAGTAVGKRAAKGTATGSVAYVGSASATVPRYGTATGSLAWVGSANTGTVGDSVDRPQLTLTIAQPVLVLTEAKP